MEAVPPPARGAGASASGAASAAASAAYHRGLALCTEATEMEARGSDRLAFETYLTALDHFRLALDGAPPTHVATVRAAMERPLARAERLKASLDARQPVADVPEDSILDRVATFLLGGPSSSAGTAPPGRASLKTSQPPSTAAAPPRTVLSSSAPPPPRPQSKARVQAPVGPSTKAATAPSAYPELQGIDKDMQRKILDLAVSGQGVRWDDIAGLAGAKAALYELVVLPSIRPEFFTGLRKPPAGLLLFGPPGCGKTMLAKAVATEAKCAFFSISAAALMSKYLGESEGLVKALFSVARAVAPSVVFIDEIDSLLSERSTSEHEATRRVKTEFLIQWDGIQANAGADKRILVMGATNRPQDLDEAATRRMPKRVYIPLPDTEARVGAIRQLLADTPHALSGADLQQLARSTDGYSQSDLRSLCSQAAMAPVRDMQDIRNAPVSALRAIEPRDFHAALKMVRPSVDPASIARFEEYNRQFGSTGV